MKRLRETYIFQVKITLWFWFLAILNFFNLFKFSTLFELFANFFRKCWPNVKDPFWNKVFFSRLRLFKLKIGVENTLFHMDIERTIWIGPQSEQLQEVWIERLTIVIWAKFFAARCSYKFYNRWSVRTKDRPVAAIQRSLL